VEATTARVDPWPVMARDGEGTVDEGAVYEEVYVVEAVPQDGDARRHRYAHEGNEADNPEKVGHRVRIARNQRARESPS
jgi:hypothetical protein